MSHQEKSIFTTFAAVLGFLVVLAFGFYFVAQTVVGGSKVAPGDDSQDSIQVRVCGAHSGGM